MYGYSAQYVHNEYTTPLLTDAYEVSHDHVRVGRAQYVHHEYTTPLLTDAYKI